MIGGKDLATGPSLMSLSKRREDHLPNGFCEKNGLIEVDYRAEEIGLGDVRRLSPFPPAAPASPLFRQESDAFCLALLSLRGAFFRSLAALRSTLKQGTGEEGLRIPAARHRTTSVARRCCCCWC